MRRAFTFSDSDQYELDLFPGVPWDGRSPRSMTRALTGGLFLRPEPPRHEVYVDAAQLEMWPAKLATPRKRPQQAAGASSLLPLKGRRGSTRRPRREVTRWGDSDGT